MAWRTEIPIDAYAHLAAQLPSSPTVTDSDYPVGAEWLNTSTGVFFELRDNTPGAAVWVVGGAPEATQVEAEAGTVTEPRFFTPERIKQAIAALGGSAPVYGSEYFYDEKTTSQSTTSTKASGGAQYFTTNTPALEGGTYEVSYGFLIQPPSTAQDWCVRLRIDGSINVTNPGGDGWLQEEGQDTGSDQRHPRGGFLGNISLAAGAHTITVNFARSATSGTCVMHSVFIKLLRVA